MTLGIGCAESDGVGGEIWGRYVSLYLCMKFLRIKTVNVTISEFRAVSAQAEVKRAVCRAGGRLCSVLWSGALRRRHQRRRRGEKGARSLSPVTPYAKSVPREVLCKASQRSLGRHPFSYASLLKVPTIIELRTVFVADVVEY